METRERSPHLEVVSENNSPTSPIYLGKVDAEAYIRAKDLDTQHSIPDEPFVSRATWELAKTGNKACLRMLRAQQDEIFRK